MVYSPKIRDVLTKNCIAYLRLKAFWTRKGRYPKEILQRYLNEIGRVSSWPSVTEKRRNVLVNWMETFTCRCGWLLQGPCTLSCGHTVCKICFEKSQFCLYCGEDRGKYILNTALDGLLEQWYPKHYKASLSKGKALFHIQEKQFTEAVELLDEVLEQFIDDFTALNLRSEAHYGLRNVRQCYSDAKRSCGIMKTCGESFFRLGEAYALLNKLDASVEAFNRCLELEPEDGDLNARVVESLDRLLSMSPGSEISLSDDDDDDDDDEHSGGDIVVKDVLCNGTEKEVDGESYCDVTGICNDSLRNSLNQTTEAEEVSRGVEKSTTEDDTGSRGDLDGDDSCETSCQRSSDTTTASREFSNASLATPPKPDPSKSSTRIKKRQRELSPKSVQRKTQKLEGLIKPQLEDFECKLCFCLLFHPVTTACGHVFCKKCLERCIDYNPSCPICRRTILCMESTGVGNVTLVIAEAIQHYFPEEIADRLNKHEEKMKLMARVGEDEEVDVPVFACTMALPGIQCPLHVFEPKYRMMLRECLVSGSNKFGMCKAEKEGGIIGYGTIVEVKQVRYLPDGRSVVDTVGGRRFKVKEKSLRDGILYVKVEYFEDCKDIFSTEEELAQLLNKCRATYDTLSTYIGHLHPSERECIINALGPLPLPSHDPLSCPNGEPWVWWALSALPMTDQAKIMMFKSQSLLDRVTILQRFLNFWTKVRHSRQLGVQS